MTDKPEEKIQQEATPHASFYREFDRVGRIYYGAGFAFLIAALIYWAVKLFFFFTEFHSKGLLDILLTPIIEFVANPPLWISLILFKISQRHRLPDSDSD